MVDETLELKVESQATKANNGLDRLSKNLNSVANSLGKVNGSGLTGFANGVDRLSTSMNKMKTVGTADFTRLSKNLIKLNNINTSQLSRSAGTLNQITKSLNNMGTVSDNSVKIAEVAKSLGKLGGAQIQKAVVNIPLLAAALKEMMATLSTAPKVSRNVINMTNALGNLSSSGAKVGSATRSINKGLKTYGSTSRTATSRTMGLASSIGLLYAKFFLVIRAVKALGRAIESSMDLIETTNYFEVVLNKIAEENVGDWEKLGYESADAYVESFGNRFKELNEKMTGYSVDETGRATYTGQKNLGMNINDVMQAEAGFAQIADTLGLVGETSINTSLALTRLGTDWTSLKNIDLDDSLYKMQSALTGQSRAVKSLGLDVQVAALQELAYAHGIDESVESMGQSMKSQLRVLALIEQSTVAFGDLASTLR